MDRLRHVVRIFPAGKPRPFTSSATGMPERLVELSHRESPLMGSITAGLFVASDVLLPSPIDLSKKLRFARPQQVHDLVAAVSRAIAPSTSRVAELLPTDEDLNGVQPDVISARAVGQWRRQKRRRDSMGGVYAVEGSGWIGTGDAGLDQLLGGGLKLGCLTEIAGER